MKKRRLQLGREIIARLAHMCILENFLKLSYYDYVYVYISYSFFVSTVPNIAKDKRIASINISIETISLEHLKD